MAQRHRHGTETRPAHVEDWLQTLPYANLEAAAGALTAAIDGTAAASLRPSVRGQLVRLYWRAYHYLLATHVKPGANPGLTTVDRLRREAQALSSVARALGALARLWALESSRQRGGLLSAARPPTEALATSLRLLAHGVLLDYHGYVRVAGERWHELHQTLGLAEQLGVAAQEVTDPERNTPTTCQRIYLELLATAVADPYHLPPAAVWSVHGLLGGWSAALGLRAGVPASGRRAGLFVVDLGSERGPVSMARVEGGGNAARLRSFDCSVLQGRVQAALQALDDGQPPGPLPADPRQARLLLEHLARGWGLPSKRYFPRHSTSGEVQVALGMSEVYWFVNGEHEFSPPPDDSGVPPAPPAADAYPVRQWQLIDRGPGGFAICSSGPRTAPVRVGDPIAMRTGNQDWQVGLIRWLMMQPDGSCRIGVRVLAGAARAVAVRPLDGARSYQRALLLPEEGGGRARLLASGGLYAPDRRVTVQHGDLGREYTLRTLLDATARVEEIALA